MRRKLLTSVALVGSLVGLSACGAAGNEPTTASTEGAASAGASQSAPADGQQGQQGADGQEGQDQQGDPNAQGGQSPSMPEPDVGDVPDVVATVNGEEISGKDFTAVYESQFQQMAMQAQMSGQELDQDELKKQTLDSMVGSELLVQDAQDKGHEATDEDVDKLLEETAKAQQLGSVDELLSTYEEQGHPEEQVRSDAGKQILMTAAIEDIEVPAPTEDELRELYDAAAAAQPPAQGGGGESGGEDQSGGDGESSGASPETPSYEELKPQLEQQVSAQKQNEAIMKRMEELRQDADVQTHL